MTPELKKQWLEALRSGRYTQAKGYLEKIKPGTEETIGNCCLGVLCLLTGYRATTLMGSQAAKRVEGFGEEMYMFPIDSTLARWGLTHDEASELADLNDSGYDFKYIADWIEKNIETEESHG